MHERARENFGSSRIDPDGLPLLELNGFIVLARADLAAAAADAASARIRTGPRGAQQGPVWNRRRAVRQRPEGLPRRAAAAGAICGSARLLATTGINCSVARGKQEGIDGLRKPSSIVRCADEAERRASGCGRQRRRRPHSSSSDHAMRGHDRAEHNREVRDQSNDTDSQERAEVLVVEDPVEAPVGGIPRSVASPDNRVAKNIWGDRGVVTCASVGVVSLT